MSATSTSHECCRSRAILIRSIRRSWIITRTAAATRPKTCAARWRTASRKPVGRRTRARCSTPRRFSSSSAMRRRLRITNTSQCGQLDGTRDVWQAIAREGHGQYFAIAQDGGVQAITTPYDDQLSELSQKLGHTVVAYGGGAGPAGEATRALIIANANANEARVAKEAPKTAQAERAVNKALNSRAYADDLLQNIENGSVKLDAVKDEDLPDDLRKLSKEERAKEIDRRLAERKQLRAQIVTLAKKRDDYIAAERHKQTGHQDGFDTAVATALKEQLARKGI